MTLQLVEWMEKLADARGKAEIADVLQRMPLTQMLKYQDVIERRCTARGFPEAVAYVAAYGRLLRAERRCDAAVKACADLDAAADLLVAALMLEDEDPPPVPDHSKTEL